MIQIHAANTRGRFFQLISALHGASERGSKPQFQGWNRYKPPHGFHRCMAHTTPATEVTCGHVLFVYDIGTKMDDHSLWRLITNYGNVINVNIVHNPATCLSMGCGFVLMAPTMAAYQALNP